MTLYAALSIGTEPIGTAVISNLGHPDTGHRPTDDDLRRYEYHVTMLGVHIDACPHGEVVHRRADGAWALLHRVLDDCRDRLPGYDRGATPHGEARS